MLGCALALLVSRCSVCVSSASFKVFILFFIVQLLQCSFVVFCLYCMNLCDAKGLWTKCPGMAIFKYDKIYIRWWRMFNKLQRLCRIMIIHHQNATGRHASVDIKFDHNVIVHTWSNIWGSWGEHVVFAAFIISIHNHNLPPTDLFVCVCLCFDDPSLLPRWWLRSCSPVSTDHNFNVVCVHIATLRKIMLTLFFRKSNSNANHKDKNVRHRNSN